MVFKRKQVIWVMTICFTLFISCLYILSLPRDTFASGIQVNGGSLGIEVSPTQALFSASNIAPGWQGSAKLQVSNAGQQPFSYSLSSVLNSGDQILFSVLVLEIQDNQGNILYNDSMGNLQNLQLGTLSPGINAGYLFTVTFPSNVSNQYQDQTSSVNFVFTASSPSSGSGGGAPAPVNIDTGIASVTPSAGGIVSLGASVSVNIPVGALSGTSPAIVAIQPVSNPAAAPSGFMVLGSAYDFTVGGADHYTFNSPVTLTFSFDPASVPAGETPVVYGYDSASNQWVAVPGTVSGNTVSVTVTRFTMYAVMVKQAVPPPVPAPPPVKGAIFTDVPESFWAYGDIENLSGLGYVSGYPDGAFRPSEPITRAEFCAIMDKVLNLTSYTSQTPTFTDVNPGDWFYQAVETAVQAGIAKGEGGSVFDPNRLISRQEVCVVLENCLGKEAQALADANTTTGFTDDASISSWARGFVVLAFRDTLIKGYPDGSFRPLNRATRAEASIMISNFLGVSR